MHWNKKNNTDNLIDFSGTKIDDNIIDKFVSRITPIDNIHYRWDLNFSSKDKQAIIGCVEGRKISPTVSIKKKVRTTSVLTLHMISLFSFHLTGK